jgi:hypothetical protein
MLASGNGATVVRAERSRSRRGGRIGVVARIAVVHNKATLAE